LTEIERKAVENFVAEHPDLKSELEIFGETKLVADENIVFSNKEILLQKNTGKIIAWKWLLNTWSVAAMLVLAIGAGWWLMNSEMNITPKIEANKTEDSIEIKEIITKEIKKLVVDNSKEIKENKAQFPIKIKSKINKNNLVADVKSEKQKSIIQSPIKNNEDDEVYEKQEEIVCNDLIKDSQKIIQPTIVKIDSIKNSTSNFNNSTERLVAELPIRTNKNQHQIIKLLAWLGDKISGEKTTDGNFNVDLGFAEIGHQSAFVKN
jgi:hypothetical protein